MNNALIGYTGFVGTSLLGQTQFIDYYNSKNITDIRGKHFSMIVCAGAPAVKWKANQNPEEDLNNIQGLMGHLHEVTADEFILISTVDVYRVPLEVDEDSKIEVNEIDPYGKHRYLLEQYVASHFPVSRIIRLPGLFGTGLKKNFIYDMLHNNCLHLTHYQSVFQFYDMSRLWMDIQTVRSNRLELVNFATEPVSAFEVAESCFGIPFRNVNDKAPVKYDMHSKWAKIFKSEQPHYMSAKDEIFAQIRALVAREKGLT